MTVNYAPIYAILIAANTKVIAKVVLWLKSLGQLSITGKNLLSVVQREAALCFLVVVLCTVASAKTIRLVIKDSVKK